MIAINPIGMVNNRMDDLQVKYERLLEIFRQLGSAGVAFSGGVDSALLAQAAYTALGEQAVALTADSASLKRRELEDARRVTEQIGIRWQLLATHELEDPNYASNPLNRCYFCKSETFSVLAERAVALGIRWLCYGENLDDQGDHRPGAQAAAEFGVRAPLKEAGLSKAEIRSLARQFNLPVWDKPAAACLSSRFPYGVQITPEKLAQVEASEDLLWELGLRDCRVRYHAEIARIETPLEAMPRVLEHANQISAGLRALGFKYVTLDLAGYRRGSLNEGLLQIETGQTPAVQAAGEAA